MRSLPLAVLIVLFVLGCGERADTGPGPEAFRNVRAGVDNVGDVACADCHGAAYEGYQAHGMAQSFYPLTPENRVEATEDVRVIHAASGFTYSLEEDAEGLWQVESRRDADGAETHRLRRRMDYVMGSGNAARTYFAERGGRLFQLPLTWYTQPQQWDFSPGYAASNPRFDRLMPDRCMACHNGYPEPVLYAEGKYASIPEGITCERCHGPGALHVEARLAEPEPAEGLDDTIVNPAHLGIERRLDVCSQCHLQTTVSVLREGRGAFDFQPSEALEDHVGLFTSNEPTATGGIDVVSHAERMRQSVCFLETLNTPAPLECLTCHDPHEGFRDQGPAYFNATCMDCHAPAALADAVPAEARPNHTAAANCIACHMPKVEASDAPHASFTDHRIRVIRSDEVPFAPPPDAVMTPYFARDVGSREGQRYLGMALVVHGRQRSDPRLMATGAATLEAGLAADTTHGEAFFLLGVAHQQLGDLGRAVPALERALRIAPDRPQRLHALAQAYASDRRDPAVVERLYRRALALQPALATVRADYGLFLQTQGRTDDAIAQYKSAREEQPWLAAASFRLGLAHLEKDDRPAAARAFRDALALQPDDAPMLAALPLVHTGPAGIIDVTTVPAAPTMPGRAAAPPPIRLVPNAAGDGADFAGLPVRAEVQVFSETGLRLRRLEKSPGVPLLPWDLRDASGAVVPSGVYLLHVRPLGPDGRALGTEVIRFALVRLDGGG